MVLEILNKERVDKISSDIARDCINLPEAELNLKLKESCMKAYSDTVLPEIMEKSGISGDGKKDAILFDISAGINKIASENYYIPRDKIVSVKYERLALPAFVGALLFGIIFYVFLGDMFADKFYAPLIGMPIGSTLLVWIFAKAAKHPKISSVIKWGTVAGFAGISIATVFSNLKGGFFGKKTINFFQWFLMALMTLLVFWMIHVFKPVVERDSEKIEEAVKSQLIQRINAMISVSEIYLDRKKNEEIKLTDNNGVGSLSKTKTEKDTVDESFFSGKFIPPVLSQMQKCLELDDGKMALSSVQSYVNGLAAMGIKPYEKNGRFVFESGDEVFFDTFGIVEKGDMVEVLVPAWKSSNGKPIVRGTVRKVRV